MIHSKIIQTSRLKMHYLYKTGDSIPVILVHGNASSSIFWKEIMEMLPDSIGAYAPDLRGFGDTEDLVIDATRGMGDFVDDLISFTNELGINKAHWVGHSMGGSAVFALAARKIELVKTLTLVNPGSPYGFGGTKDLEGTPHWEDFAGSGAGVVNPEFARRISIGDRSAEDPLASPRVVMNTFYWKPPFVPKREEELLTGVLSEKIGPDRYPGDAIPSNNWPNAAPGIYGPANALSPKYVGDTVAQFKKTIANTPILWIRGAEDQIVSDQSLFDLGTLGKLGFVPGYPGEDIYPSQPMVGQMRAVLDAANSKYVEIVMEETGHTPFVEQPENFLSHFIQFVDSL
jgi:pimeloyl-ACP methyl ester carboxylesterase